MLDECSNRGAKHEMGGPDFKRGGGHPCHPVGDGPASSESCQDSSLSEVYLLLLTQSLVRLSHHTHIEK